MRLLMITPGERDILQWLADGGSRTELAVALDLSEREVDWRLSTLFSRMGVGTTLEAVMECKKRGLFSRRDDVPSRNVFVIELFAADRQPARRRQTRSASANPLPVMGGARDLNEESDGDSDRPNPLHGLRRPGSF